MARKTKAPVPPTWPRTKDQKAQSRPLIYIKPLRHLAAAMLAGNPPDKDGIRSLTKQQRALLRGARNAPRPLIERALAHYA
jgi:CubicO group peptidase (beta-lactamase class C family)